MSNNCLHRVVISHQNLDELNKVVEEFNNCNLFQAFRPAPKNHDNDWWSENWGPMEDVYDVEAIDCCVDDWYQYILDFSTAWTPAVPFFRFLNEQKGFDVNMVYYESGSHICGEYVNGYFVEHDLSVEGTLQEISENIIDIYPWIVDDYNEIHGTPVSEEEPFE